MFIKKKLFADLEGGTGKISDTINVQDKTTNAPSIRLMEEVIGNSGLDVITDTDIYIWNLESGVYRLPENITIKYSYNGMVPPTYEELTMQPSTILIVKKFISDNIHGWFWTIYSTQGIFNGYTYQDTSFIITPLPYSGSYTFINIDGLSYKVLLNTNTTTSATLSDNIYNYKRIKIFAISNDSRTYSVEIYNNNSSSLSTGILVGTVAENVVYYGKSVRVDINGNSLTMDRQAGINISTSGTTTDSQSNAVTIYRVEGYKY